ELAVDRCAETRRHPLGDDLDDSTGGRAGLADLVEVGSPGLHRSVVRREERVAVDLRPVPARAIDLVRANAHEGAADGDAGQDLARDGPGGNAHRRLAGRRAPAAAVIADAVLLVVGVVGVSRPELVLDVPVVLRALVDIVDDERDRRARRDLAPILAGENARQDLDLVRLPALRGVARRS